MEWNEQKLIHYLSVHCSDIDSAPRASKNHVFFCVDSLFKTYLISFNVVSIDEVL